MLKSNIISKLVLKINPKIMINSHEYNEDKDILKLDLSKSEMEINLKSMVVTYKTKEKNKTFDFSGEYEIDGYYLYLVSVLDTKVILIAGERTILILPRATDTDLLKLVPEINSDLINIVDILVLVGPASLDIDKKLIQTIEPRSLVKISGSKGEKDIEIDKFNIKNISFPEDNTNTYLVN